LIGIIALWIAAIFTFGAFLVNIMNSAKYRKQMMALRTSRKSAKASKQNAEGKAVLKPSKQSMATVEQHNEKRANLLYDLSVVCLIAAAVILWIILLTDQFTYRYAAQYSSADLSVAFKITAFWAGQEGSFLLWVLIHGLIGLMLNHRKEVSPGANAVFSFTQICLLIILIVRSPFAQGPEPLVAQGLNPLLQNFWMISHPPFLFLGYAALAVPFALAVGALLDGNTKSWIERALPYSLFAWAFLGVGNFLGGYWAYEVLGWGGYWAWDPVENSSLIPWLVCGGLVHFLLLARRKPLLVKPVYLTAIAGFSLALYGTFLTRSGILLNFSTHSFGQSSLTTILMASVIFPFIAAAFVILIIKWKELPSPEEEEPIRTRGFMTYAGSLGLCLFVFVVFLGTSMPFITKLIGNSTNVAISYYNSSGLLAVVFILITLLFAVVYPWVRPTRVAGAGAGAGAAGSNDAVMVNADEMAAEAASVEAAAVETDGVEAMGVPAADTEAVTADEAADKTKAPMAPAVTKIGVALAGAVLFAAAGLIVGIHQSMFMTMMVLLGLFAAGAVFAISILAFGKGFGRGMSKAALVTHIGLTLLVAGVLFSSAGAEKESPVSFKAGEQKTVLGRQITFIGTEELTDNPGYLQKFEVNGEPVEIASRYHGERFGYERKPAILWSLFGDYYVAPDVAGAVQTLSFGVPKRIDVEGERIELTLKDFGMASEDADDPSVFVLLDVVQGDKHMEVNLQLLRSAESEMYDTEQVPVFDKYNIFLESISPTNMTVSVYVYGINETLAEAVNKVNLEVSTKPLIVLVWLGTIVVSLGIIWAALRRWGPSPFQDLHNRKQKKEAIM